MNFKWILNEFQYILMYSNLNKLIINNKINKKYYPGLLIIIFFIPKKLLGISSLIGYNLRNKILIPLIY